MLAKTITIAQNYDFTFGEEFDVNGTQSETLNQTSSKFTQKSTE